MADILVIDDNAGIRKLLLCILTAAGHSVIEAGGGTEGLVALRRARPTLVITDIVMEDGDGIETIREMRREAPTIPILAMSGSGVLFLRAASSLARHRRLKSRSAPTNCWRPLAIYLRRATPPDAVRALEAEEPGTTALYVPRKWLSIPRGRSRTASSARNPAIIRTNAGRSGCSGGSCSSFLMRSAKSCRRGPELHAGARRAPWPFSLVNISPPLSTISRGARLARLVLILAPFHEIENHDRHQNQYHHTYADPVERHAHAEPMPKLIGTDGQSPAARSAGLSSFRRKDARGIAASPSGRD